MTVTNAALTLRDISKAYREGDTVHVVLDGVNATIRSGEFVALLGPSGSGKSTLLNIISGIDLPDSGAVLVGDTDIVRLSERERTLLRRRSIGFIFQFFNLIPTLTVLENVLLPLELVGTTGDAAMTRARDLLQQVELEQRADTYPDRLSGGEQQRVAIARAIAHDPPLVLADEPTGNLDAATGSRVLDIFERIVGDHGKTAIVVTHSQDVVRRAGRVSTLR